ncbi:unnamed protein product [Strongylus vulgaris]|uniref:Serpentine receptor class gamma n=1 Tax=Strongylus vulgaris TaxID=40348 RepID=A0A3P7IL74_STRVU|nr:unnamed protein product [Strongylus vulgaris]
MAVFSVLYYVGSVICYITSITLSVNDLLNRIVGSNHQSSQFAFIATNIFLAAHRLLYAIFPFHTQKMLSKNFLKLCIALIIAFYIAYTILIMTPLASVMYCSSQLFFYFDERPLTGLAVKMNQIFNFAAGIVSISLYTIIFATLFLKGNLTFKKNHEIQMTVQAAVVSAIELIFFLYWEYGPPLKIPAFWLYVCDGYTILIYFDVLILPYLILNRSVKTELKNILFGRRGSLIAIIFSHTPLQIYR